MLTILILRMHILGVVIDRLGIKKRDFGLSFLYGFIVGGCLREQLGL